MAVSFIEVRRRQAYEDGKTFGETGAYERLDGVIGFAADPEHPLNQPIVDLSLAQRDANGRVSFIADFCVLQPVDPARSRRRLLFEVLNRGRKLVPRMINGASAELVPTDAIGPGDGFLFRHGWTVAWCGWQWDVIRGPAMLGLEAPEAVQEGRAIEGWVSVQFQPNRPIADALLADRVHRPYPVADVNDLEAQLYVRDWRDGPRTLIPRERWRFAREVDGRPVDDATRVWLEGGFAAGRVYEVVFRTNRCPVVGTGLLAVRDAVSFLRYGGAEYNNPCAGRLDRAYGFGASQSGRFLRHFLYAGMNLDEERRQVFDGALPHIAGGRRGDFNNRYAQPSQTARGFGNLFPFNGADGTDPLTEQTDGLLRRQRSLGGVPRVISTNTAAEYWRGDGSLAHTDPEGKRDVEPSAEERIYLFAGTQHSAGVVPLGRVSAADGSTGLHNFNAVDYTPLLRAALVNLERWASEDAEPPPSAFPRLADGTAQSMEAVLARFRELPGASAPDPVQLPRAYRLELGPEASRGVGRYPVELGEPYPVFVSAVDSDGNEVAGVRAPDVAVPVATYTGWNPRDPITGGAGQLINMQGSTLPFSATSEERRRTGDPRPSIAERYRDRDDYLSQVRAAAEDLAARRLLLAEDVDYACDLAARRYDAFAATPQPVAGD